MLTLLFIAVVLAQMAIPAFHIFTYENALHSGAPYKFRTGPVDPADPFRGRYLALSYADTVAPLRPGDHLEESDSAYVTLGTDEDGFALFTEIAGRPPRQGEYIRVTAAFPEQENATMLRFRIPFDRLYLGETVAPRAERAYRDLDDLPDRDAQAAYVLVRVRNGVGAVENLFIHGKTIREFVQEHSARE